MTYIQVANKLVAVSAATLLLLNNPAAAASPKGWFLAGSKPAEYDSDVDKTVSYNGAPSAVLRSKGPVPDGFGTMMQSIAATDYLGKRVRLSGFVKSESVESWAGLWMRVDKGSKPIAFDNMHGRPIKGTTGWKQYEVVLDVAKDATGLAFGILMDGPGAVWLSSVNVEVVGTEVAVTAPDSSDKPANLGFEQQ